MLFFPGWHNVNNGESGTKHFDRVCISYNRLCDRKSSFPVKDWLLDCGFTRVMSGKSYPSTKKYASTIYKWATSGNLWGASTQDYPCFDEALGITKLTVPDHQRLTIHRYRQIKQHLQDIHYLACTHMHSDFMEYATDCDYQIDDITDTVESEFQESDLPYVIPILQGKRPEDYTHHLEQYGDIPANAWVGVGSLKRRPINEVEAILASIKLQRPDLRLHGFGLSTKQLNYPGIVGLLFSADSQAGGLANGSGKTRKYQNANDPLLAIAYAQNIDSVTIQTNIFNIQY